MFNEFKGNIKNKIFDFIFLLYLFFVSLGFTDCIINDSVEWLRISVISIVATCLVMYFVFIKKKV
ncbi:MAG: hypothetical protein JW866_09860 [Ignavibacteriales bacterium]|nr:hypothetical protein [Ignavibacteriales bacterium]